MGNECVWVIKSACEMLQNSQLHWGTILKDTGIVWF